MGSACMKWKITGFFGWWEKESSMDQAAIETLTYFTAIFWLGGFTVGLIIKLILPQKL